jgi:hypothetical protein
MEEEAKYAEEEGDEFDEDFDEELVTDSETEESEDDEGNLSDDHDYRTEHQQQSSSKLVASFISQLDEASPLDQEISEDSAETDLVGKMEKTKLVDSNESTKVENSAEENDEEGEEEEEEEDAEHDIEQINNKGFRPYRDTKEMKAAANASKPASTTPTNRLDEAEIRKRVTTNLKRGAKIQGKKRNSVKASARADARDAVKRSAAWS